MTSQNHKFVANPVQRENVIDKSMDQGLVQELVLQARCRNGLSDHQAMALALDAQLAERHAITSTPTP